jgi:putative ABC transport system permease protein
MPVEIANRIAQVEGVAAVAPVVTMVNPGGGFNIIYGLDPESFNAVSGGFEFLDGEIFDSPDEALIDDRFATSQKAVIGSEVTLKNRTFKVSGIVQDGKGARVFVPIGTAQEMEGREGKASLFYVKANNRDDVPKVIERLSTGDFEGYQVTDVDDFASLVVASTAGLLAIVFDVIVFIGLAVGVLVIFLSMYTTITERTREIGILRSLGASKAYIVLLIVQEALLICVIGVFAGIGTSYLASNLIRELFPMVVITITPDWLVRASIFAILSGVIGSFYPALKAAAKDPVEALAYE